MQPVHGRQHSRRQDVVSSSPSTRPESAMFMLSPAFSLEQFGSRPGHLYLLLSEVDFTSSRIISATGAQFFSSFFHTLSHCTWLPFFSSRTPIRTFLSFAFHFLYFLSRSAERALRHDIFSIGFWGVTTAKTVTRSRREMRRWMTDTK